MLPGASDERRKGEQQRGYDHGASGRRLWWYESHKIIVSPDIWNQSTQRHANGCDNNSENKSKHKQRLV